MKIKYLKFKAKRLYLHATTIPNYMDCGLGMAYILRPDMRRAASKFNDIMDQLTLLDPATPKIRLNLYL